MRPELALFDGEAVLAEPTGKAFDQHSSDFRSGSAGEPRSPPPPDIPVQGELGNDEHRAADVRSPEVHLPGVIFEHSQNRYLVREPVDIVGSVAFADADKDRQSTPDLTNNSLRYLDGGEAHALDYDSSHLVPMSLILSDTPRLSVYTDGTGQRRDR